MSIYILQYLAIVDKYIKFNQISILNKIQRVYAIYRLVYDRETGKPKGYGFCEYKDSETAQSAMRNLNGTEIHGRQLRVDSAASQKGNGVEDPKGSIFVCNCKFYT